MSFTCRWARLHSAPSRRAPRRAPRAFLPACLRRHGAPPAAGVGGRYRARRQAPPRHSPPICRTRYVTIRTLIRLQKPVARSPLDQYGHVLPKRGLHAQRRQEETSRRQVRSALRQTGSCAAAGKLGGQNSAGGSKQQQSGCTYVLALPRVRDDRLTLPSSSLACVSPMPSSMCPLSPRRAA